MKYLIYALLMVFFVSSCKNANCENKTTSIQSRKKVSKDTLTQKEDYGGVKMGISTSGKAAIGVDIGGGLILTTDGNIGIGF